MSIAGTMDAPLDLFGGLVTDMAASDLPQGVSPDCQDVAFLAGGVKTRPGLAPVFSPIFRRRRQSHGQLPENLHAAEPAQTLLALDSTGTLWGENSPGVLSQVATGLAAERGGEFCVAFWPGIYRPCTTAKFGVDMPRQYDGTNFDRVSQCGPGAGVAAIADIIVGISAISRTSNVVTVTTSAPIGMLAIDQVTMAGVTDTSFNGTFAIASIIDSLNFTYAQTNPDAASSGGTAAPVGSISAGVHQCVVIFVTRQGYLTRPSPPVSWTSAGNCRAERDGDSVSHHAAEYRGAHSGVHGLGRRQFLLHHGPGRRAANAGDR